MKKMLTVALLASACLIGCNKSPKSSAPARPDDVVQQKLKELAGSGATDCGRLDIKAANDQLSNASTCATKAADKKQAFYIAYDMPGMSTGVAGNSGGQLFALQLQGSGTGAKLESGACPGALRVAPSGRLTCFIPGTMGLNATGADPHSGIPTTPGASPHGGGMGIPQPFDAPSSGSAAPPKKK